MNSFRLIVHLKNEKIQIALRILIIMLVIFTLPFFNSLVLYIPIFADFNILHLFLLTISLNILYYLVTLYRPMFYYKERILIISILDVLASAYVMYLVGAFSAYYPALFLWYNIGYGMRFGTKVGFSVYFSVLVSWILLMTYSTYWSENFNIAFGWLIAFALIPLYHFRLVKQLQSSLSYLYKDLNKSTFEAQHDNLTKLPNRLLFEKELLESTQKYKKFALFFIDLDGFKKINDNYGHHVGDTVLVTSAERIGSFGHFAARLGGDEFICIVEYKDLSSLKLFAEKFITLLSTECETIDIKTSSSVGISLYPYDTDNLHELKKKSDIAMYGAKKSGRNNYKFFNEL